MANQMIALQARNPQLPDPARATTQMANMINMASQQRTAQLQGERARQEMDYATAREGREAELQTPKLREAGFKADEAQIKMLSDFNKLSIEGLRQAQSPEDAVKIGDYIKSKFTDPGLQASVDQTVLKLTANPANFEVARQQVLFQSMENDKQLEQRIAKMTTGDETYEVSAPKYAGAPGGMGATEVAGTRQKAPQGIIYVKGDDGSIYPMPKTTTGGFATPPPPAGSSGSGSPVANALKTNPGALKDGPFAQSQPGYTGKSGGFATFDTPQAGIAAQEKLLLNSYINKGANTINKIVNKYAPQGPENSAASVSGYKEYIRRRTGIDINTPITAAQIPAVAKAMREFETDKKVGGSGTAGAPVAVIPGSGAKAKPSTEGERRFGTVSQNMTDSMKEATAALLESSAAAAPSGTEYAASLIPFYGDEARKFAQSGPRQRFEGALLALLDGVTFINTGAGTSKTQEANYKNTYVPTYQDTPKSRKAKLDRAIRFIENSKAAAGVMWTPEIDRELKNLKATVAKIDFGGGATKRSTPTKSSDGWGTAKQVGN